MREDSCNMIFFCEGRKRRVEIVGAELLAREDWVIWCALVSNNSYANVLQ
jgi:hypothetical protein